MLLRNLTYHWISIWVPCKYILLHCYFWKENVMYRVQQIDISDTSYLHVTIMDMELWVRFSIRDKGRFELMLNIYKHMGVNGHLSSNPGIQISYNLCLSCKLLLIVVFWIFRNYNCILIYIVVAQESVL